MFVVHVNIHVKKDRIAEFIQATKENAMSSLSEPGVYRFDIYQQDQEEYFLLEEVYKTQADAGKHKDTPHYKKWKNTVENMMADPRSSVRLLNIFPSDEEWKK